MTPRSHVPAIRRARSSTEVWQSVDLRDAEISKAQSVIGKPMNRRILTVVSATVDTNREAELVAGFRSLLVDSVPDGLLHTQLLKGANGGWQIQTLWRDRAARESMRAASEPPAAPRLFRSVGADPNASDLRAYGRTRFHSRIRRPGFLPPGPDQGRSGHRTDLPATSDGASTPSRNRPAEWASRSIRTDSRTTSQSP
jgi:hypothetical protein